MEKNEPLRKIQIWVLLILTAVVALLAISGILNGQAARLAMRRSWM